jgi:O-antigen ligase
MLQISPVLIAFLIACDLASQRIWRWRLLATMAWTGVTIAAYGILQRVGFLPAIAHSKYVESVFASYDYHGNAGAFLNLIIPAVFVAVVARKVSIAGVIGLATCLAAVLVNVSRAAMVVSIAIVVALALWARRNTAIRPNIRQARRRPITAIIIVAVLVIACAGSRELWRRWRNFPVNFERDNPRVLMDRIAYHMARDAGWFGDGPGSFKLMFPGTPYMIPALYPRWEVLAYKPGEETNRNSYVHNDYLQFAIEWGWIGSAIWGCLLLGGLWKGWGAYHHPDIADDRPLLAAALIALGGILVHATVDWPLQVASLELYAAVYLAILWSSGEQCASC